MAGTSAEWLERDKRVIPAVLSRYFDVVAETASGSWITDVEGKRYLDFGCGIAVTNVGHCHPQVVSAIQEQVAKLMHVSVTTHHTMNVQLCERLGELMPFFDEPQMFLCNSGAEAVDGSIKLARKATGKPGILAFQRGFHGRTIGATTLTTAKGKYRSNYEPLMGGAAYAPYCVDGDVDKALAALDTVLSLQMPASNLAAMIVEPVLGEGGYIAPPSAWLHGLRERCDAHGALLIFDEVQCGMGRVGTAFAAEHYDVRPDVLLFAKGIASGMPLGGIAASRAVMDKWPAAAHGTTYGGNPVACASAIATIDVLQNENCFERARVQGKRAVEVLREAAASSSSVREVRGVGLMIGIEFTSSTECAQVQQHCRDQGLLVLTCGPGDNVVRLAPPLNMTDEDLEKGLAILSAAIESV